MGGGGELCGGEYFSALLTPQARIAPQLTESVRCRARGSASLSKTPEAGENRRIRAGVADRTPTDQRLGRMPSRRGFEEICCARRGYGEVRRRQSPIDIWTSSQIGLRVFGRISEIL